MSRKPRVGVAVRFGDDGCPEGGTDLRENAARAGVAPREVILDAVAAGDSHEQIADELGITRAAVKLRLARMRETFAERVEKEGLSHRKREKG